MPGKKMKSIKKPKVYEALKDKGMSKGKAAAISNGQALKEKDKLAKTAKAKMAKVKRTKVKSL